MRLLAAALVRTEKMVDDLSREDQITYAAIIWRRYGGDPLQAASTGASTATSPPSKDFKSEPQRASKDFKSELPKTSTKASNGLQAAALNTSVSSFFLQFWSEYPRRQGKQEALVKYGKLKPDQALQDRILTAVREQKTWEAWTREDGRFIPLPSSWLHQHRWEDEVTTSNAPMKAPSLARRLWDEAAKEEAGEP